RARPAPDRPPAAPAWGRRRPEEGRPATAIANDTEDVTMVVGDRPEGPGTAGPTDEQPSVEDGEEVLVDLRRLELSAARRGLALDRVRRALQGEPPHAAFQPIFDLSDGELVGVEALARFASRP